MNTATRGLLRDRLVVTGAAVLWIIGTLLGLGLVGGSSVSEQGAGLFSDHATLIAPHGPAFSIWSAIYLGLAGYVIWQWLPVTARQTWAGRTRIPAAATLALNGIWLLVVQAQWVWGSVLVIALLVAALGWLHGRISGLDPAGWGARIWVQLTFGLYLGWICVATCANVALALVGAGVPASGFGPTVTTMVVLLVVLGIFAVLAQRLLTHRWSIAAVAAAIAWGLGWAAFARYAGELRSLPVVWAAALAAVAVIGLAGWRLRTSVTLRRT